MVLGLTSLQAQKTVTIMCGIQPVMGSNRLYTVWTTVIPDPFYCGLPSYAVVYGGKPLSFSIRDIIDLLHNLVFHDERLWIIHC